MSGDLVWETPGMVGEYIGNGGVMFSRHSASGVLNGFGRSHTVLLPSPSWSVERPVPVRLRSGIQPNVVGIYLPSMALGADSLHQRHSVIRLRA